MSALQLMMARARMNHRTPVDLWTPLELATPPIAMFNDSSPTTGTTTCAQWNDLTAHANNLVQTNPVLQPALDVGGPNGRGYLSFNGGSNYMQIAPPNAIGRNTGAIWVLAVLRKRTDDTVDRRLIHVSAGNQYGTTRFLAGVNSPNAHAPGIGARRRDADTAAFLGGTQNIAGDWHMVIYAVDYTGAEASIYVDGTQDAHSASFLTPGLTDDTAGTTGVNVCAYIATNSASNFLDCDLGELVIGQDAVPAAGEIDKLFGYAAYRWGLQALLPPGHPYKTSPP